MPPTECEIRGLEERTWELLEAQEVYDVVLGDVEDLGNMIEMMGRWEREFVEGLRDEVGAHEGDGVVHGE